MDFQQMLLIIMFILSLMHIMASKKSPKCQKIDFWCFMRGTEEVDELFLASETYTPRNDVEHFKDVKLSKLERYGDSEHADKCTWQNGIMYNSTCPHHYVLNIDKKGNLLPSQRLGVTAMKTSHVWTV